jgi:hypothetical protein
MQEYDMEPTRELLLDSHHGIYIPQLFSEMTISEDVVSEEQKNILKEGPDNEYYWDVWTEVLDNAEIVHDNKVWRLEQEEGDLWAVEVLSERTITLTITGISAREKELVEVFAYYLRDNVSDNIQKVADGGISDVCIDEENYDVVWEVS